jgi:hypothetical protein
MCALLVLEGVVNLLDGNHKVARVVQDQVLILEAGHKELAMVAEERWGHWAPATLMERSIESPLSGWF